MTHEAYKPQTKSDINLEIKRLKALQNQHRGEKSIFDKYAEEIQNLVAQRDLIITNSHSSFLSTIRSTIPKVGGGSTHAAHIAAALESKEDD